MKALLTLLLALVGTISISLERAEGREMVDRAADLALSLPPGIPKAYAAVLLLFGNDRYPADVAGTWFKETMEIFAAANDSMGQALATNAYGTFLEKQQLMSQAREMYTAAYAAYSRNRQPLGDRPVQS